MEHANHIDPNRLYGGPETAQFLGVSAKTIQRWRLAGRLPARYPAGRAMRPRYLGADIIAARERVA